MFEDVNREYIKALLDDFRLWLAPPNTIIWQEGEQATSMFFVFQGRYSQYFIPFDLAVVSKIAVEFIFMYMYVKMI